MKAPLINELKTRRNSLGWSVKELAERSGMDEKLLTDWEHGLGSPRLEAAEAWATALGLALSLAAGSRDARPGVRIDWDKHCITVDGTPVRLTPMEWKALERLARVPGELVTHQALFRHLYGEDEPYRIQSTAIRVLITKLRRLLPIRIEARWGRGYVVSGIDASASGEPGGHASVPYEPRAAKPAAAPPAGPASAKAARESITLVPRAPVAVASVSAAPVVRDTSAQSPDRTAIGYANVRRVPSPVAQSTRSNACRAEELGVIEQFLAERGATRCPDVATIQRTPLPTLVWDKMKRKWVRPSQPEREAS